MGKTFKAFEEDDVGAMGIGAMIIFIAMVLVAGIAASVLVQTANNLQIRAMETGAETTAEVSTGLYVISIDGNGSGGIAKLNVMVKLRAGSRDIDINKTVIEISNGAKKCILFQDGNSFAVGTNGTFNQSVYTLNGSMFGVIKIIDVDDSFTSSSPVMNRGDCIMLTINTTSCFYPGGLAARDDVWGQVIPEEGVPAVFSFRVPPSLVDTVYRLY